MYSGTGSFKPRFSTWQYLQQPIPVFLFIHLVSNSRHIAQNTVGPFHLYQVRMEKRSLALPHKNVGFNGSINQG